MIKKLLSVLFLFVCFAGITIAQDEADTKGRMMFGGYGELVFRNFDYSDDFNRYLYPDDYDSGYNRGQTDIPHLVFFFQYDFGKGWKFSTEVEFEHGGSGGAVEIEAEEFGEYELEIEKGGEIALEQFWIEKSFSKHFNLRLGHFVVPVGGTNFQHFPTEYFTVMRPEGESVILPLTWHETGVSLWGKVTDWRYEVQLINGLDADGFGAANWIKYGTVSPYEFKMATNWAGAFRVDNYSVKGLRVGVSGYYGHSAGNTLKPERYEGIDGEVSVISGDFGYQDHNIIMRGNFVYGSISDAAKIGKINKSLPKNAPSPHTDVASEAMCYSFEAGYNIFSFFDTDEKFYPFVRYEYYNSMEATPAGVLADERYKRDVITTGINYYPMEEIVLKAEYSSRMFNSPYNTENTISAGVMFAGLFNY